MQMNQVRYFLAIYEEQSFTRAARRCGVSQPSLTNAIQRLEHSLGGLLFHRTPKNTVPTALGRAVARDLRQINRCVHRAKRKAGDLLASQPIKPFGAGAAPLGA